MEIIGKKVFIHVSDKTVEEGRFIEYRHENDTGFVEFRGAFWEMSMKRLTFPNTIHSKQTNH